MQESLYILLRNLTNNVVKETIKTNIYSYELFNC